MYALVRIAGFLMGTLVLMNTTAFALSPVAEYAYVFFAPGSAKIDDRTKEQLLKFFVDVYGQELSHSSRFADRAFCIKGTSDGSEAAGNVLSIKRAIALQEYLIELGLPRERIYTRGVGAAEPLVENVPSGTAEPQNRFAVVDWSRTECRPQR